MLNIHEQCQTHVLSQADPLSIPKNHTDARYQYLAWESEQYRFWPDDSYWCQYHYLQYSTNISFQINKINQYQNWYWYWYQYHIQVVSKKCKKRISLIFWEPRNRFLNCFFFFWKLRSIWKVWIQNQFCVILGRRDICKPKWDYETDTIILVMT